jgi:predicted SnoaL-like aldol condensation-catalyzing enzyme
VSGKFVASSTDHAAVTAATFYGLMCNQSQPARGDPAAPSVPTYTEHNPVVADGNAEFIE